MAISFKPKLIQVQLDEDSRKLISGLPRIVDPAATLSQYPHLRINVLHTLTQLLLTTLKIADPGDGLR